MSDQDSSGSDDLSLQDSDPSSVVSVVGRPRRSPVWDHFINFMTAPLIRVPARFFVAMAVKFMDMLLVGSIHIIIIYYN